jgi:hypothetical protein
MTSKKCTCGKCFLCEAEKIKDRNEDYAKKMKVNNAKKDKKKFGIK